jgi:hypothetical protein
MFGRRLPATKIQAVDAAFDQAEANARQFGREVAQHIASEFKAGNIDRKGVDAWVSLACEQTASKAIGVPKAMLRQILAALHRSIRTELAAAGITIPDLPAWVVDQLSWWEKGAYQRGISTATIEAELAEQVVRDRLQGILHMEELQVFGRLSNPLSTYFAFETKKTIDEVRAETIAIRQALAEIGIPGMALKTVETNPHE